MAGSELEVSDDKQANRSSANGQRHFRLGNDDKDIKLDERQHSGQQNRCFAWQKGIWVFQVDEKRQEAIFA